MSDDDFDVELLALAGDGDRQRKKKRQNSSSGKPPAVKRRKADLKVKVESDMEPESEEDVEVDDASSNPYPLEGKYIDEVDKARLLQMPEIEREQMLAARQEEMQRLQDKLNLDHMLKVQSAGSVDVEHVSQAAKRKHVVRGATKEKSRKLDELKAKRKAKEERSRALKEKVPSPSQRRRSLSSEPELSDVTDEEGEINKDEDGDRKFNESLSSTNAEKFTQEDLEKIRVTRSQIAKHFYAPWFEQWITGAWVRYLIGNDDKTREPIYRACEVVGLSPNVVKSYKVNDLIINRTFELKHGKATRVWSLDKVSDAPFTTREYERVVQQCREDGEEMPSLSVLEKKKEQLVKLPTTPLTEADISLMINRKNALNPNNIAVTQAFAARAQLVQERNLALKRQDYKDAAHFEQELEALNALQGAVAGRRERSLDPDVMARVNERNRKANLEAVRKAEAEQAARKRQERKLQKQSLTMYDVSARLRTIPRTHHQSRTGTPNGTPKLQAADSTERSVSPMPGLVMPGSSATLPVHTLTPAMRGTFEARVVESIHIELDDF